MIARALSPKKMLLAPTPFVNTQSLVELGCMCKIGLPRACTPCPVALALTVLRFSRMRLGLWRNPHRRPRVEIVGSKVQPRVHVMQSTQTDGQSDRLCTCHAAISRRSRCLDKYSCRISLCKRGFPPLQATWCLE